MDQRPTLSRPETSGVREASPGQSAAGGSESIGSSIHASSAPPSASASGGSQGASGAGSRDTRSRFTTFELAIVLSHYDVGPIDALQEFPRGSRKAPKLLIRAESGYYLLKRRARGKDDPYKVAFCHAIQIHLADHQFPLPHLIGTRRDHNSMLRRKGRIYELFEHIKGETYDGSLGATQDSGRILGLFHKLLRHFECEYEPARGSYHRARSVASSMRQLPQALADVTGKGTADVFEGIRNELNETYEQAANAAEHLGLADWPAQIVHSDWHPGNMLYRRKRVVGVIDYDAARIQQRVIDVANGALQFSILGGEGDPRHWPEYLDESRFRRFIRGYDAAGEPMLTRAELQVLPHLMIEALIAESVIPIAATGTFGRVDGVEFLHMVQRKARWLNEHGARLVQTVES